jgi:hypothetical protein
LACSFVDHSTMASQFGRFAVPHVAKSHKVMGDTMVRVVCVFAGGVPIPTPSRLSVVVILRVVFVSSSLSLTHALLFLFRLSLSLSHTHTCTYTGGVAGTESTIATQTPNWIPTTPWAGSGTRTWDG